MNIVIRPFTIGDYVQAAELWENTPGIGMSSADQPEKVARFLERNPGLSFAACDGERIIGTVLGGHDGRRGYLYHMAVHEGYRLGGVARRLGEASLTALRAAGIEKCHIFVYSDNKEGINFWEQTGWKVRDELIVLSHAVKKNSQPTGSKR